MSQGLKIELPPIYIHSFPHRSLGGMGVRFRYIERIECQLHWHCEHYHIVIVL